MRPERWREIEKLYHEALALEGGERAIFLDRVCSDDGELRSELDSLLAFESRAENFIESPAFEVAATMLKDQTHSPVGQSLGPYQVLSMIGAGGMGEVYLAQDTRLGRQIALKVLPSEFTRDQDRLRRFEQEARAASALNHPNILTIFEIGHDPSAHYIATEYIQGETLRRRLAQGPLDLSRALDIACQIASALAAAHDAGIVHRDIKPENLMLRPDGYVKVLDFGIAKLTEQYAPPLSPEADTAVAISTETGVVLGTTSYMSPEQARGQELDARSDLFSLGVVLYEMVAGTAPFRGPTSADVLAAILVHEAPPPSMLTSNSPEALDRIISTALRKDREYRYQDARTLLNDLKDLKKRVEFEDALERSTSRAELVPVTQKDSGSRESQTIIYSLAVLPLANTLADPGMDYFSDGVTESIINSLAALPDLQVMAWSTVSGYKNRQVDPRSVGRDLGVHAVLTGRVIQRGDRLVIKTELVNASSGFLLWAESYSCEPADIFRVEEEISKEISEKLLLRLSTEERRRLTKRFTENTDAYHAYLKGRYFWNKRTDEDVRQGIEYFKQAIESDPGYALAYAGLADSYIILGSFGVATMPSDEACPRAREAATRALEIDGALAEAHASLAYCLAIYYWDWPAAHREFQTCFELKPGYSTGHHWYGFVYLVAKGLLDEAISEEKRAGELDPLSLTISANLGLLMYLDRRYDEAITQYQKTLEMDRNFAYAHWQLGLAYEQKEMYEEATVEFKEAAGLHGKSTLPLALLGHAYAVSGRNEEARAVLDELHDFANQRNVSAYRVAAIFAGLGDRGKAFEWLGYAFEQRDPWLIWLKHDPVLDPIRPDRRFKTLVRKIGLDGAGAKAIGRRTPGRSSNSQPKRKAITSLAIMPLANVSGDPEMEYLSDGITETIINQLSQLPKIRVTARGSVFRYKGQDPDPRLVGRQLGVQAVLTGRIRQTEDRLIIAAELTDVSSDSQLWGEQYNRKLSDIFEVQREIAKEITEKLRLKLNRRDKTRIARQYTTDVEAYHAYLKGRYLWNKRDVESLRRGIEYFKQAIDRDPSFALAYAGLSDSHTLLVVREALPPEDGYSKAKAAARKALEIDEDLAEAHASLGHAMLHNWEWEEGESELKRAIELNPGYPSAHHWYSEHLTAMGRCAESIKELELAAELDPLSLVISADLGRAFYYAREYDRVIEQEARTLELDSTFWLSHINLGRSFTQKGMHAEAIDKLETATRLSVGNTEALAFLAFAYAAARNRENAQRVLAQLDQQAKQTHVPPYHYAVAYSGLGDQDRAFDWLELAFQKHSVDLFTLKVEPMFDVIRSDPRFDNLLRRVGLLPPANVRQTESEANTQIAKPVPAGIAILPFRPINPQHRDEYLELGIADALITRLSDIKQIVVRPTSSVRKYTDLEQDSVIIGREMAVESVLEGCIQKLADRIRITARLVRVEDGRSLWTGKFDEDFTDIFAVEDSISEKVAAALALRLTRDERERLTKRYTDNTAAYSLYLKGRYYWNKRTEESLNKAVECFNQALEIDPEYVLSHAGLADCYTKLGDVGVTAMTSREAFARAHQAALKALEIDNTLPEVHASLGHLDMHLLRWADAERDFKRAIELNPNYASAHHWYAYFMAFHRRFDDALRRIEIAQQLDPLSLPIADSIGEFLYFARRNDEAIVHFRKTLELDPNFLASRINLGRAYEQLEMFGDAEEQFLKARQVTGESIDALAALGHAYAMSDNNAGAREILAQLIALSQKRYVSPYDIALIYAALGETDEAFNCLESAHDQGVEWMIYTNIDPRLEPLRGDPRFSNLLQRLGFAPDTA